MHQKLARIIKHYDLTMAGLAEMLQIGRGTMFTYVKGKQGRDPAKFPAELLCPLIKVLPDLNPYWLITGEGEMISAPEINPASKQNEKDNEDCREKVLSVQQEVFELQKELLDASRSLIASKQELAESRLQLAESKQELINCIKTLLPDDKRQAILHG